MDAACDSNIFSSIDFNSGYHQIPCTNRAKQALEFSPGYGYPQLTWKVMPPGVKNASGYFQRTMGKTFAGHENRILPPYFDDVVIKGTNFRDHVINVRHILDAVRAAGFTHNALKCSFFQYKIAYLGHIIQKGAVTIDPSRVAAINTFPVPHDVHSLRRFIGMVQFCRKFIPKLNVILTPLFKLLNTNAPFEWTPDCEQSFHSVKSLMTNAPVLCSPTRQDHTILETDACDYGFKGTSHR